MSTSNPTFVKDPNASKDYPIDWSSFLETGESIDTSEWIVPSGITLVSGSDAINGEFTVAWFSGGTAGVNYSITNRIVTDSTPPRTEDASILILVRESSGAQTVALMTLPEFKGMLAPTQTDLCEGSYDTFLLNFIEAASAEAELICDRKFRAANYLERVEYEFRGDMLLRQYPIIQILSIHTFLRESVLIQNNAVNATRASVRVDKDRSIEFRVIGGASHGVLTVDPTGYADNLNDLVDSINALGSGWSASLAVGCTGYELLEDLLETVSVKVMPGQGQTATLPMLGEPVNASWEIDHEGGAIFRNVEIFDYRWADQMERWVHLLTPVDVASIGTQRCWVRYRAGYEIIPRGLLLDLAAHIRRLVQMDGYNPFLSSEKIGAYSYSTASLSGVQGSVGSVATTVSQDFERSLQRWRRIPI